MKIQVLFFGITTDLTETSKIDLELPEICSISNFKVILQNKYPQLNKLNSYAIAVNEAYAINSIALKENDIVAVIPPVSGG